MIARLPGSATAYPQENLPRRIVQDLIIMPEEQNQPSDWTPKTLERLEELLTQFKDAGIDTVYDVSTNPVKRSTDEVLDEVKAVRAHREGGNE